MAANKTQPTAASVAKFLAGVTDAARRAEAEELVRILERATGWKATMWGTSIVGFGIYDYTYDSGRSGSMCVVGFSPRKSSFAIYVADFEGRRELLDKLGKHKGGDGGCLYIQKLRDVDTAVLARIVTAGAAQTKRTWSVRPS
jgi:hypothetical protein